MHFPPSGFRTKTNQGVANVKVPQVQLANAWAGSNSSCDKALACIAGIFSFVCCCLQIGMQTRCRRTWIQNRLVAVYSGSNVWAPIGAGCLCACVFASKYTWRRKGEPLFPVGSHTWHKGFPAWDKDRALFWQLK